MSLIGSALGLASCWYKLNQIKKYNTLPEPNKTIIFVLVSSTSGLLFILLVVIISGSYP